MLWHGGTSVSSVTQNIMTSTNVHFTTCISAFICFLTKLIYLFNNVWCQCKGYRCVTGATLMSRSTIKRILWKKSKKLKWFTTTRNYRAEIKSLNLTIRIYTSYRARSENHHPLILLPFVFSRVKMYFSHFWFLPRTFWFTNISWKPEPNDSFKHHFHFQGPKMSKIQWHLFWL